MYNWENYIKEFKKVELSDTKEKYTFRISYIQLLRKSLFLIILLGLVSISLIDSIKNDYKIKLIISIVLIVYVLVLILRIAFFKIEISKDVLNYGKAKIPLNNVKSATLTIGRISTAKVGRCLEIIDNNKKEYVINLDIHNSLRFLKILENRIGQEFIINEGS